MKIISWNVANRVSKQQRQMDALLSRKSDVIGLQEVTKRILPFWMEGLNKAGYKHTVSSFSIQIRKGSR